MTDNQEILEGLTGPEKSIPSRYHYDERGSELFEQITRLDEYYPTRTEKALLEYWIPKWVEDRHPATLVELGAGNSEKSRLILDAMVAREAECAYVPIDVSGPFLQETARQLAKEYPTLKIAPLVADIMEEVCVPPELPGPRWVAFLGSTLGNFEWDESVSLLEGVAKQLDEGDRFLLGVDLRPGPNKSVERIDLAYNDAAGVTAKFSLNILAALNHEFGTNFDLAGFRHRSAYSGERGRIETFIESLRDQTVRFPTGEEVSFAKGESTRTEISCKYDRATIDSMFSQAGLVVDDWVEDDRGYYALVLAETL
jgi:L-histidine Nalpha-methyltransferase